jgi:hypothetical protein
MKAKRLLMSLIIVNFANCAKVKTNSNDVVQNDGKISGKGKVRLDKKTSAPAGVSGDQQLNIWNGTEDSTKYTAALNYIELGDLNNVHRVKKAGLVGSATGYLSPGCYITNDHVLRPFTAGSPNFLRTHPFSVLENAADPEIATQPQAIEDRQKLSQSLFFPVLQKKTHKIGSLGDDLRDLAVFYVPPVGFRYSYKDSQMNNVAPSINKFSPVIDRNSFAALNLGTRFNSKDVTIRGYGARTIEGEIAFRGNGDIGNVDQRLGVERRGTIKYGNYVECISRPNGDKSKDCFYHSYFSFPPKFETVNNGDSGGPIIASGYGEGIVGLSTLKQAVGETNPYIQNLNNNDHLPVSHWHTALGINPYETSNYKFLTDPKYALTDTPIGDSENATNVKVTCRPKPFISHGPGVATKNLLGNVDYVISSAAAGGYVTAKNVDAMGEYQNTNMRCGRLNSTVPPVAASTECNHNTWNNKVLNNSPIITLRLEAKPWEGWKFKKWVGSETRECLCKNAGASCELTNDKILSEKPELLVPWLSQICVALFEPEQNNPPPCPDPTNPTCVE